MSRHWWSGATGLVISILAACGSGKHLPVAGDYSPDSDAGADEDACTGALGCVTPPTPPTMPIHVGAPCDGVADGSTTAMDAATVTDASDADGTDGADDASFDSGSVSPDSDATRFAKAIGICTSSAHDGYGLVSASFSKAFGSTAPPPDGQWGILPKFGAVIRPREGEMLGALSSGYAREYDTADGLPGRDFVQSANISTSPAGIAPPGFPKAAAGCIQDNTVNDVIDVHLVLKAPADATGFQFDFNFYSSEWPEFVCSNFNDAFVAYLTSVKKTDNVSFDAMGNPVAVNNAFFDRCTKGVTTGCSGNKQVVATCDAGTGELAGTGYSGTIQTRCTPSQLATDGGATGWLTTHAPIEPGEVFMLDLMIWNAGDEALDSSVLIDNWTWLGGTVTTGTTRVN